MIKLHRIDKPIELTKELELQLKQDYLTDPKKSVWNKPFIKESLTLMGHGKCCYCETSIIERGTYMEVEHFLPKKIYPEKVIDWNNLLPSCKTCNGNKSDFDPQESPIINPTVEEPNEHIWFDKYFFKAIDIMGQNTIEVIDLNEIDRLMVARMKVAEAARKKLRSLNEDISAIDSLTSQRKKTMLRNSYLKLLKRTEPDQRFSATIATILVTDEAYTESKEALLKQELWTDEHSKLDEHIKRVCFNVSKEGKTPA